MIVALSPSPNLTITDLSYRFQIFPDTAGRVFHTWIEDFFIYLKCLIKWKLLVNIYHLFFADLFPNTICIIDCLEVFIHRPYGYVARAKTYYNYKKTNTIKFLIGVQFLSCWGWRASDRCITMNSGFLDLLSSSDTVLADRGFTIGDDVAVFGAKLEIPAFTSGKNS